MPLLIISLDELSDTLLEECYRHWCETYLNVVSKLLFVGILCQFLISDKRRKSRNHQYFEYRKLITDYQAQAKSCVACSAFGVKDYSHFNCSLLDISSTENTKEKELTAKQKKRNTNFRNPLS
ncbi:hypothetical protein TNCV_2582371 [Trichonephila clavipes]|nr:hypothetical protein TNCV_2582371 [Trichonephila clavipes]